MLTVEKTCRKIIDRSIKNFDPQVVTEFPVKNWIAGLIFFGVPLTNPDPVPVPQ